MLAKTVAAKQASRFVVLIMLLVLLAGCGDTTGSAVGSTPAGNPAPANPDAKLSPVFEIPASVGHTSAIKTFAISPDGSTLASGGYDNTIKLWAIKPNELTLLGTLLGHSSVIAEIAFSSDGKTLYSAGDDLSIKIWDVTTRQMVKNIYKEGGYSSISLSPDGKTFATGGFNKEVRLWNIASGTVTKSFLATTAGGTGLVAYSKDGKQLAVGSWSYSLAIWDTNTFEKKVLLQLDGRNTNNVMGVAYSPNGNLLAAVTGDGVVRIWDAQTYQLNQTFNVGVLPLSMAFSPDSKTIAIGNTEHTITLYDLTAKQQVATFVENEKAVRALVFNTDNLLISGSDDSSVKIWDIKQQKAIFAIKGQTQSLPTGLTFSPDGTNLLATNNANKTAKQIITQPNNQFISQLFAIESTKLALISPDNKTFITSAGYDDVKLWDAANGKKIAELSAARIDWGNAIAYSPDGKVVALDSENQGVTLWDTATGAKRTSLLGQSGLIRSLSFSPDGRLLAAGNANGKIVIWDVSTGKPIANYAANVSRASDIVWSLAFSPDSKLLAAGVGTAEGLQIFEISTGKTLKTLQTKAAALLRFSADGKTLLGIGYSRRNIEDSTISIPTPITFWNVADWKELGGLTLPDKDAIRVLSLSANGKRIAAGYNDGAIKVWDIEQIQN